MNRISTTETPGKVTLQKALSVQFHTLNLPPQTQHKKRTPIPGHTVQIRGCIQIKRPPNKFNPP